MVSWPSRDAYSRDLSASQSPSPPSEKTVAHGVSEPPLVATVASRRESYVAASHPVYASCWPSGDALMLVSVRYHGSFGMTRGFVSPLFWTRMLWPSGAIQAQPP